MTARAFRPKPNNTAGPLGMSPDSDAPVRPAGADPSTGGGQREALIAVSGLKHAIGGRPVLDAGDWKVAPGQHSLVLGPSGSGKTTFFNILTGLTRPTEGSVRVDGMDLAALDPAARDRARGRLFGIVFQSLRLVSSLTVRQNLRMSRALAGKPPAEARIVQLLDGLGLRHRIDAKPRQLSQGEAQRAAIARAAIADAPLIVADEPSSALDRANAAKVIDLLFEVAEATHATLIVATHDDRITDRFDHALHLTAPGGAGS